MSEKLLDGVAQSDRDRAEPILRAGNTNCGGCGMSVGLNMLSLAVAKTPVQVVIPACCGIVTAGAYPTASYSVPVIDSTFSLTDASAAHALMESSKHKGKIVLVVGNG